MPWQKVTPIEEINRFVMLARNGRFTVTDLCEQFGVSRKTGYKETRRSGQAEKRYNPNPLPARSPAKSNFLSVIMERRAFWFRKPVLLVL